MKQLKFSQIKKGLYLFLCVMSGLMLVLLWQPTLFLNDSSTNIDWQLGRLSLLFFLSTSLVVLTYSVQYFGRLSIVLNGLNIIGLCCLMIFFWSLGRAGENDPILSLSFFRALINFDSLLEKKQAYHANFFNNIYLIMINVGIFVFNMQKKWFFLKKTMMIFLFFRCFLIIIVLINVIFYIFDQYLAQFNAFNIIKIPFLAGIFFSSIILTGLITLNPRKLYHQYDEYAYKILLNISFFLLIFLGIIFLIIIIIPYNEIAHVKKTQFEQNILENGRFFSQFLEENEHKIKKFHDDFNYGFNTPDYEPNRNRETLFSALPEKVVDVLYFDQDQKLEYNYRKQYPESMKLEEIFDEKYVKKIQAFQKNTQENVRWLGFWGGGVFNTNMDALIGCPCALLYIKHPYFNQVQNHKKEKYGIYFVTLKNVSQYFWQHKNADLNQEFYLADSQYEYNKIQNILLLQSGNLFSFSTLTQADNVFFQKVVEQKDILEQNNKWMMSYHGKLDGFILVSDIKNQPLYYEIYFVLWKAYCILLIMMTLALFGLENFLYPVFMSLKENDKNQQDAILRATEEKNKIIIDLERFNRRLEAFTSIASHDLQNPLRSNLGFIRMLLEILHSKNYIDGTPRTTVIEYIEIIQHSSHRMLNYVMALLSFAKGQAKSLDVQHINFKELLQKIIGTLNQEIKENQVKIIFDFDNFYFKADSRLIEMLWQNLISNAIKYQPKSVPLSFNDTGFNIDLRQKKLSQIPNIHIEAKTQFEGDGEYYYFSIQDNGIGIPSDKLASIFEVFTRLHASDEYEGSGVGLASCEMVVVRHQGKIWVNSVVGEGTKFEILIPVPN